MKTTFIMSFVTIAALYCFTPALCPAAHDDETLKGGGAWRPAEMNVGPDRSGAGDKIDTMINRSLKKSEIIIPPLENEQGKEPDAGEREKSSGGEVEKQK